MSGEGYVDINLEQSESDAAQIESVSQYLQAELLEPRDAETTLEANGNLHAAFDLSQIVVANLGEAMDKEVLNIRSVGNEFEQYDNMLADLAGSIAE